MARKSKYIEQNEVNIAAWRAALYIRLSREDGDKEESDSISNQKQMLMDFVDENVEFSMVDIYIDDGWSGTNFKRPNFQRMMDDIKSGKVNCVIVKDLSRFGRNYIEAGNYLEQIFPFLKVRFISITEMLDSVKNPNTMNSIMIPFKNLINDEYCRDISNKVKSALNVKRKNGEFVGSFTSYGYQKDPENKGHLIIDKEAADVVAQIYEWYLEGYGMITIAKKLNAMGVPNPSRYKRLHGHNYKHPESSKNDGMWNYSTIRRILTHRIYCGDMVQGVVHNTSYKVQKTQRTPESEWIIVENTHEGIVSKEIFNKVQNNLNRDTRTSPEETKLTLFAGFVKCADCKRAMNRRTNKHAYGTYEYYVCSTYKKQGTEKCTRHTMRIDQLEKAVLQTIQMQITLAVDIGTLIDKINNRTVIQKKSIKIVTLIEEKKSDLNKLIKAKESLYIDWKSDVLTKNEFLTMKESYSQQIEEKSLEIAHLKREQEELEVTGVTKDNLFITSFLKYKNINKLTRDVLTELIDNIYVHEDKNITIKFKFRDEMEKAIEFVEMNTGKKVLIMKMV